MWPTHYIPLQDRIEGVPPPRIYLTTMLYPVEVEETLQATEGRFVSATPGIGAEDNMQATASFVSAELINYGFLSIEFDDAIETVASFTSGELVDRLLRYTSPPDMLASTAMFIGGDLVEPLVRYENWPLGFDTEDLLGNGSFVSGELA